MKPPHISRDPAVIILAVLALLSILSRAWLLVVPWVSKL
jgi:hypothetical protein